MLKSLFTQLLFKLSRRPRDGTGRELAEAGALEAAIEHHRHGRVTQAEAIYAALLEKNPGDAMLMHFLGNLCLGEGRVDEGVRWLERAIALRPGADEVRWHLGLALHGEGRHIEAARVLQGVSAASPDVIATLTGVKDALIAGDRLDEAEQCCHRLIELAGSCATQAKAHSDLGTLLMRLGRLGEAIEWYRSALDLDAGAVKAHSNLLYAMHYTPDYTPEQIFEEHLRWARMHTGSTVRRVHVPPRNRGDSQPLRVGYVSPDFCNHPVVDYIEPVLRRHDRTCFEVYCYSDVARPDQYTDRLKTLPINWRETVSLSDAALAEQVAEDRIDILVDLAGHTRGNRLLMFSGRPAPVQVTWIGYPDTTGLREMDYRITDALTDPPGQTDHLNTETLIRLPESCVVFQPPAEAPEINPLPALTRGTVTYGSFNALAKITPEVIAAWARILLHQPRAHLLMLAVSDGRARVRLREAFAAHGVGSERLEFRGRTTFRTFLEAHHEVDIALDPFPCAGHSTSFVSLWMGVPVVTLAGATHVSRFGVTVLSNVGLDRFIAGDIEQYVTLASSLADNPEALSSLRAGMREQMRKAPSMDESRFARELEAAYQEMWNRYCGRQAGLRPSLGTGRILPERWRA